ncbi:hypothetical protein AAFF_G00116530 [Aldrovandia affinis]|uniref:Uncharacterized protein n=1 Tax=Aldrovandia affinis TaxID=143900 RepID=A0AAD7T2P5_9TELE|nr:hypothetical protein AAFF_G00116530 [Aldrovandia affinis]
MLPRPKSKPLARRSCCSWTTGPCTSTGPLTSASWWAVPCSAQGGAWQPPASWSPRLPRVTLRRNTTCSRGSRRSWLSCGLPSTPSRGLPHRVRGAPPSPCPKCRTFRLLSRPDGKCITMANISCKNHCVSGFKVSNFLPLQLFHHYSKGEINFFCFSLISFSLTKCQAPAEWMD